MAQDQHRGQTAALSGALSLALLGLNVYVCRELFRVEYLRHMGSIEGAFIALARYISENWRDLDWFPLWYGGIPGQNAYPPFLHALVAAASSLAHWTPALAYHRTTALVYCLGPVVLFWLCLRLSGSTACSFAAGIVHSVLAPSAFLIEDVRRDLGGWLRPRRLQVLVMYGEGPHVAGLVMLGIAILALDQAVRRRRPVYYVLAAVAFAATVLTNWLAAVALSIAIFAYLLSSPATDWVRSLWTASGAGLLAYLLAAPWIPPSTIRVIQFNARTVEGDYRGYTQGLIGAVVVLILLLAAARLLLRRTGAGRALEFGAYFALVSGAISLGWAWRGIVMVPQPHRYYIELEWGLAIAIPFAVERLLRNVPRTAMMGVAGVAALLAVPCAKEHRRYARYALEGIDIRQRVEYKLPAWLRQNMAGRRVMVPGSTSFWLNAFCDNPQLGGGFDQGATNPLTRIAVYVLYTDDGAGAAAADISLLWLKAFGVDAIAVGGPKSGEVYRPFRNPGKFAGRLDELWRDGDDILYRVPRPSQSLAHVVEERELVSRVPANGVDVEPLRPYVEALERPGAAMEWTSRHSAVIRANMTPSQVLSVQATGDPGWSATANGRAVPTEADKLGLLTIRPHCNGACEVRINYDGGAEGKLLKIVQWLALALCAGVMILTSRRSSPTATS